HAPGGAAALISCGIERLVIRRIHYQLGRPRVFIGRQDATPGQATISGFVNATLAARAPEACQRGDVDDIVVYRVNNDARDVFGSVQSHILPGLAAISRFINAVAPRRALPIVVLTAADPD